MNEIRMILVAVKDPDAKTLPAVVKAMQIAKATRARVELFHVISDPLYEIAGNSRQRVEFEEALLARYTSRLEAIAARFRRRNIDVSTEVKWDFPAHEAVIRRAKHANADLIVAERHAARHAAPWLLKYTDWELVRLSPVPVLLVKQQAGYRKPRILAALDPAHTFAKPAGLDARILASAETLAEALHGTVDAMHAYEFLPVGLPPQAMLSSETVDLLQKEARKRAERGLEESLKSSRLSPGHRHIVHGLPCEVIPAFSEKLGSQIVVMGAISRSGLKALIIGNTAERVIDSLKADILVVKPKRFQTPVRRTSRGMRLVASPFSPAFI